MQEGAVTEWLSYVFSADCAPRDPAVLARKFFEILDKYTIDFESPDFRDNVRGTMIRKWREALIQRTREYNNVVISKMLSSGVSELLISPKDL